MPDSQGAAFDFMRRLPHNVEAEMAVLGGLLLDPCVWERVEDFLQPQHFMLLAHQRLFQAMTTMHAEGKIADPVTLKPLFEQDAALQEIGGLAYLGRLADCGATPINAGEYARHLWACWKRRELIAIGDEIISRAYADEDADTQLGQAEQALFALLEHGRGTQGASMSAGECIDQAFEHAAVAIERRRDGKVVGLATGFKKLDELTGGLHAPDLVIIAARPSMGKTDVGINIAANIAQARTADPNEGAAVLLFSLEMSCEQIGGRLQARRTNVSGHALRTGMLTMDELLTARVKVPPLNRVPLIVDDTQELSLATIRARARRVKRKHELGLVIVDYLQLIRPADAGARRGGTRAEEVGAIARGLKAMAKELNVPVLALAQLSRAVEQRDDKRPQLSDLRESGAIEQDADVVAFLYREHYYLSRKQPRHKPGKDKIDHAREVEDWQARCHEIERLLEVSIGKQRHGPIKDVKLYYDQQLSFIGDLEER